MVWAATSVCGNLGSLVGLAVLILSVRFSRPELTGATLVGGVLTALGFLVWLGLLGKSFKTTVAQLWTRAISLGPAALLRRSARRVVEQIGTLVLAFARRPIIPGAALVGLVFVPDLPAELGWYLAAVTLVYALRGDGGRQALIPYWPLLAVLATRSVQWLSDDLAGLAVAVALGAAWLVHSGLRAYRVDPGVLSAWSCPDVRTARAADRCRALLESAAALRRTCGERSLLVYGPFSQAYVLAGAAFPTSIIVPSRRLDALYPRWQARLSERLVSASPGLVLDTDRCFDAAAVRTRLGRDYELRRILPGDFRLYSLSNSTAAEAPVTLCDSFAPQTPAQRHLEECRMMLRRACGGNVRARSWAVLAPKSNFDGARDVARRVGLPLVVCTDHPQEVLDRLGGADVLVVLDRPSDVWLARLEAAAGYRLIYTAGQFDHGPTDDQQPAVGVPVPQVAGESPSPASVDAPSANRVPVATFG
ncbi:MAG: hypothetical protein IID40_06885, partial [Planctomycetes bacterium]|nr:hypothetical protein [Planctomycetota bacterium]